MGLPKGKSLNFWVYSRLYFIKKNWLIEISPNCLPKHMEINQLNSYILASSRDRLYDVDLLLEAWAILDKKFWQCFDLKNKLKQEFLSIRINAKSSPHI